MKYQPSPYLASRAGELLGDRLHALYGTERWDLIVPVPSSPEMLKKRLFHPCLEIGRGLQRRIKESTIEHALKHRGKRTPQARRSHEERLQGLRTVFTVNNARRIGEKRILLVEDVITTGATVAAASHALREAGARSIDVVALAEARVWRRFRSLIFALFQPPSGRIFRCTAP
jgi:predicted amidophosphoribosyltransferase